MKLCRLFISCPFLPFLLLKSIATPFFVPLNCCRVAVPGDCFNLKLAVEVGGGLQVDVEQNGNPVKEHWPLQRAYLKY